MSEVCPCGHLVMNADADSLQYQKLKARALLIQREKEEDLKRESEAKVKREKEAAKAEEEVCTMLPHHPATSSTSLYVHRSSS
jgi:hypothetical protein